MKNMMKNVAIAIALIVIIVVFASCAGNRDNALVGRWRMISPSMVIEFNRNGTGLVNDNIAITWSTDNGRLILEGFPEIYTTTVNPIRYEFNGVHDYRITAYEGSVSLYIWVQSPDVTAGDILIAFRRLGAN